MGCGSSQVINQNPANLERAKGLHTAHARPSYAEKGLQKSSVQDSDKPSESLAHQNQPQTRDICVDIGLEVAFVQEKKGIQTDEESHSSKDIYADQLIPVNLGDENTETNEMTSKQDMASQIENRFPELKAVAQQLKTNVAKLEEARKNGCVGNQDYWNTLQEINRICLSLAQNSADKNNAFGELAVELGIARMLAEDLRTFQSIYEKDPQNAFNNDENWNAIYYNLVVNINYTDSLMVYSRALVDNGGLDIYKYFLEEVVKCDIHKPENNHHKEVVKLSAESLVNLSRAIPVHVVQGSGIVEHLIPLVHSPDQSIAVASLIALSAVVNEEQNNLLMTDPEPIKMIIKLLKKALDSPNHPQEIGTQWSVYELANGLSQIASNDINKIEIVKQGGLPVLNKFLRNANNAEEQESAARCFWMLSFNDDNVAKIKELPNCLNVLRKLKKSSHSTVARAASGALWEIEQKEQREQIRRSLASLRQGDDDEDQLHIMISYQWDVQNTLIKVKNHLQQYGYRVWMDIEMMQGSTLEEMAKAVENAAVVLMCVSSKYKDSPNCRTEAEYAFQLKKDIVPLMMEPDFRPDGWLGMICGAKFWYDFREKIRARETMEKLSNDLKERAQQALAGFKGTINKGTSAPVSNAPATRTDISNWTGKDVVEWINGIGLKTIPVDGFSQFTGDLLEELYTLRKENPDFYYLSLKNELGISRLIDVLKFNKALSSIV